LKEQPRAASHLAMEQPVSVTMFSCNPEAAMLADLIAQQQADERDRDARLDLRSRLHDGPCDCCREDSPVGLVLLGDEAVCPGCAEARDIDWNTAVEESWLPVCPAEV
jgi:hypothetical protein